jgi:alpha-beta hydrolase superfamily lysophospholipase
MPTRYLKPRAPRSRSRRLTRSLGTVLLVLFVLLNVLLAFQAYRFTYFYDADQAEYRRPEAMTTGEKISGALLGMKFPKRVVDAFPAAPYRTVTFRNEQGQRLEAWDCPPDAGTGPPRGTVVLFHGHASAKSKVLTELAYFRALGYRTLAVDFRAHGNSEGHVCTIGYHEVGDVRAAYQYARQAGERPVILWGVSMGAATILKAIAEFDLRPDRVILECPFASMQDAVQGRIRTMGLPATPLSELLMLWGSAERRMWGFGYQPAAYARALTMPVQLHWGAQDPRVLRHETERIFSNLGSREKELVVFESSGHESFGRNEAEKWRTEVAAFLKSSQ